MALSARPPTDPPRISFRTGRWLLGGDAGFGLEVGDGCCGLGPDRPIVWVDRFG